MSTTATDPNMSHVACSEECLLRPGNTNCGGCGMSVALTLLGRVLAEVHEKVMLSIPACCGIVTAGGYPTTSYSVPTLGATFASCAAFGSGMAAVRDINEDEGQVICWAGDGGTYDIGMATVSAAAERNDNLIYMCYDNEIYGNTGGQRSSATPIGARTSTTPHGKREGKKDIMAILSAHGIPYCATLSLAHPEDFKRKLKKGLAMDGFRFFLIHAPCPTGWKSEPGDTVELVRIAVDSGLFPVYEVEDGVRYRINAEPTWSDVSDYYDRQRRFPKGNVDVAAVTEFVKARYDRLRTLSDAFPITGE